MKIECFCFVDTQPELTTRRALEIGCAVGRATFELTRVFDEVIGVDYSKLFIETSNRLKMDGRIEYSQVIEGELMRKLVAVVDPEIVS